MAYNKFIKSKKYKNVYCTDSDSNNTPVFLASGSVNGVKFQIYCKTEREAALKYDMKMIEKGGEPKNILKRINK